MSRLTKIKVILYYKKGCLALATTIGYKIYSTKNMTLVGSKDLDGGLGHIAMLFKSNLLILVGGGPKPRFSKNSIILWDDKTNKQTGEVAFKSEILKLEMNKEM